MMRKRRKNKSYFDRQQNITAAAAFALVPHLYLVFACPPPVSALAESTGENNYLYLCNSLTVFSTQRSRDSINRTTFIRVIEYTHPSPIMCWFILDVPLPPGVIFVGLLIFLLNILTKLCLITNLAFFLDCRKRGHISVHPKH